MDKRHIVIGLVVAAFVAIFAVLIFVSVNQAPSVDGSVPSTESENRVNDSGIAAPAGPPDEAVSPPQY